MSGLKRWAATSVALAAFAAPALAQEAPPAAQESAEAAVNRQAVLSFTPADFADARPNTALDLVNRLPGFSVESGDQVRGFAGAAGNVLLDGQRPTTKSDNLNDVLGRIPITQVERVDLIRGGGGGIDMQGRSVVANIITRSVDSFQQVVQLTGFLFTETGHTVPGWNYQATRRNGPHQFDVQFSRGTSFDDSSGSGWRARENFKTGVKTFQNATNEGDGFTHRARAEYKGPVFGGTLNLNGSIGNDEFKNEQTYNNATTDEHYASRSYNDRGEIGLNYKHPIGDKLEIELVGLSKIAWGSGDNTGRTLTSSSQFSIDAEAGESIGRSVLHYTHSPTLTFEGGGEVALNYREQQIAFISNGAPVALPAADVRIEELRSEAFAQGTWRPSDKYSLEAGVRVERSKITQSGDTSLEREFTYTKPRVLFTWSPTKSDQLRLRVEREVGQLNFQDFISNVDLGTSVLSAGNAQLQPDKTWAYEAAFEKRFWDNGAVVLTLRHEDITDVSDVFPFVVSVDANNDGVPDDANGDGRPDQRRVAGPGNIGDGTNDVLALTATLPLDRLHVKNGELKVEASWENSKVTDPLTGEERRFSDQRPNDITMSFRKDVPNRNISWGVTWFAGWAEDFYYLEEKQMLRLPRFMDSFVEWKPSPKFTLRAELKNFIPYHFNIMRQHYDGPRDTGQLEFFETDRRNSQVFVMLRGRWTIG